MITKVALTAWKRLMPYLGEDAQRKLIRMRKPLAEYNTSVAKGVSNRATELGIEAPGFNAPRSARAEYYGDIYSGGAFNPSGKADIDLQARLYTDAIPSKYPHQPRRLLSVEEYAKDISGGSSSTKYVDNYLDDTKKLFERYKDRPDSVPILFLRRSRGTAKDDFFRNLVATHELSEGKHVLRNYKISPDGRTKTPINGIELARPRNKDVTGHNRMGHFSLGVLRDELKDILKSGHIDLHKQPKTGILSMRTGENGGTNELPFLLSAGKNSGILGGKNYTGTLRNGEIKKMQKRFFTNLDKVQRSHNVRGTDTTDMYDWHEYDLQNLPANRTWLSWKRHKRNRIIPKAKEWMQQHS